MPHHARLEEVSDSDSNSDPSEMDPTDFDPTTTLLRPAAIPPSEPQLLPHLTTPTSTSTSPSPPNPDRYKHYQCLYPLYFDASRTRTQGRRVCKSLAVTNPLAREMVDAVQALGLSVVFEPGKTHPKDWSNPGRVRVLVKEGGRVKSSRVRNKHHLYTLVSAHLRAHPTTETSPLRLRIAGVPAPEKLSAPAVPEGWRMGSILPLHSPAMSGGGVSDNFLKEMMQDLQGQQGMVEGNSGGGGSGTEVKRKKEKKKGKA